MSETTATTTTTTTPSKAKKAKSGSSAKKAKPVASHPPVSEMVLASIKNLKERNGSSAQAIKKYISTNYKVESDRLQPFIKKYLKSSVTNGVLTQTKGKGANGSFKLAKDHNNTNKPKTKTVAKPIKSSKPKKASKPSSPAKKTTKKSPKKSATKAKPKAPVVKKTVEKKTKTQKTAKSPKKVISKPKPAAKKTPKRAPKKA